jgi:hypothetical protein
MTTEDKRNWLWRQLSNARHRQAFNSRIKATVPVFIYQMAKLGSITLSKSLLKQYKGLVFAAHILDPDHSSRELRLLYKYITQHKGPLKVISLTRDPVGKNVSHFFQGFERYTGMPFSDTAFSTEKLKSLFLDGPNVPHYEQLTWYEENFQKYFNIDVFAAPFPKEKGRVILSNSNVKILLMKSELSNAVKEKVIGEFLGIENFRLENENVSDNKLYKDASARFKHEVKLPASYLDKVYNSPYARHFYTDEEIKVARSKWEQA